MPKRHWLMKCEPAAYTIDDLARDGRTSGRASATSRRATSCATTCRKATGPVLCLERRPSGVTGLARIARAGYPDPFAWKKGHKYYDEGSTQAKPVWYSVDLAYVATFPAVVSLEP